MILEEYPVLGFNYRLTDIQAAIGREQLARLPARALETLMLAVVEDPPWARELLAGLGASDVEPDTEPDRANYEVDEL